MESGTHPEVERVFQHVVDRGLHLRLRRAVADAAVKEGWKFDELHTEEGRLDDVFRSITLPDSVKVRD